MKKKILMFVYNNFTRDARVMKEAKTLVDSGYSVDVVAVLDKDTVASEKRDGYNIIRIQRNPIHYRFMALMKKVFYSSSNSNTDKKKNNALQNVAMYMKKLASYILLPIKDFKIKMTIAYIFLSPIWAIGVLGLILMLAFSIFHLIWQGLVKSLSFLFNGVSKTILALIIYIAYGYVWATSLNKSKYNRRKVELGKKIKRTKQKHNKKSILRKRKIFRFKNEVRKFIIRSFKKNKNKVYNSLRKFLLLFHKPLSFIDFYIKAYKLMKDESYDVYHCHDLNTLPIGHYLKKKNKGILIYDSHELYTETSNTKRVEKKIYAILEKKLIKSADKVITVCDSIAEELVERYNVERPDILMNCPPPIILKEKYNLIRNATDISEEQPVILYQGGFSVNRGLFNLIESMKYVDNGVLVMMGWGKIEDELRAWVTKLELSGKVVFIPPAPQNDLLYWSSSADLGVIPYQFVGLNNYYSCPNKLFEYIGAGLPIICSNFPELSKIVEGYELGCTFDPEKPEEIAEAINKVLKDKMELSKRSVNSLKASEMLNWDVQSVVLKEIYKGV